MGDPNDSRWVIDFHTRTSAESSLFHAQASHSSLSVSYAGRLFAMASALIPVGY